MRRIARLKTGTEAPKLFGLLRRMTAVLSVVCMVLSSTDLAAQAAPPAPVTSQAAAGDPGWAFRTSTVAEEDSVPRAAIDAGGEGKEQAKTNN
ncbi:MAG TPA: hypothetical protein VK638_36090 [Edaphobacter sp.]|nr:hypothetical protein [Edaphobacter sp.]